MIILMIIFNLIKLFIIKFPYSNNKIERIIRFFKEKKWILELIQKKIKSKLKINYQQ